MPIDNKGASSNIITVTGETVQLYYNNSGTLTADAGQAAGVVVVGQLAYDNVKNVLGSMEAIKGDTSLSFTSTALTTEKAIDRQLMEQLDETSIFNKMSTLGALLSNGEYYVDYNSGTLYAKKASTQTSLTSTTYKYRSSASFIATNVFPALTTVASGELAGNTGATQMPTVSCKLVKFKAEIDNAGNVYIGGSGVTKADGSTDTTTGFQLAAGEETPWMPVTNLNLFYRICDNAGDDLTYIALA